MLSLALLLHKPLIEHNEARSSVLFAEKTQHVRCEQMASGLSHWNIYWVRERIDVLLIFGVHPTIKSVEWDIIA